MVVRSFNLDDETAESMDAKEHTNWSSVVRDLLREYETTGKTAEAANNVRIAEINAEIKDHRKKVAHHESEIERLQNEREDIRDRERHRQKERERVVAELTELVRSGRVPRDQLDPTSEVVRTRVEAAQLTPERLVERVEAELAGGEV